MAHEDDKQAILARRKLLLAALTGAGAAAVAGTSCDRSPRGEPLRADPSRVEPASSGSAGAMRRPPQPEAADAGAPDAYPSVCLSYAPDPSVSMRPCLSPPRPSKCLSIYKPDDEDDIKR